MSQLILARMIFGFQSLRVVSSWLVVSKIFYFHPYLGKWSNLTNIFQMGWNHQPGRYVFQKKEYQKRSLESTSERGFSQKCTTRSRFVPMAFVKRGSSPWFFHLKTHGKDPPPRKKSWNQPPRFTCKEFSTFKKSMSTDFSPKIPQKFLTYLRATAHAADPSVRKEWRRGALYKRLQRWTSDS